MGTRVTGPAFDFVVAPDGTKAVVSLKGELDVAGAGRLRDCLVAEIAAGRTTIMLDLAGLEFIDSTGLGVIVSGLKRARERGGDVVLRAPNRTTRRVLEITGLDRTMTIEDDAGTVAS